MTLERTRLLQDYAACRVSWHELQRLGFVDYLEVLGGLGELGLRPPMEGPNVAARQRGMEVLRQALSERTPQSAVSAISSFETHHQIVPTKEWKMPRKSGSQQ